MNRLLTRLTRRVRALFHADALDAELSDEIRAHVEFETEDLIAMRGLSREEARRQAMIGFGGLERYREAQRDARGVRWIEQLAQDVKYGVRSLRRTPAFTVTALLTIALGIGATTTVFSVVDRLILHPLPFANEDRTVLLDGTTGGQDMGGWVHSNDVVDWEREAKSFDAIGMLTYANSTFLRGKETVAQSGSLVSASLFSALGVRPIVGRLFTPADTAPGAPHVVLLGEAIWKRNFGSARDVIGNQLISNDTAYTVVGVVPDALVAMRNYVPTDFWLPITSAQQAKLHSEIAGVQAAAVIKRGVSREQAQRELTILLRNASRSAGVNVARQNPSVRLVQPTAFLNGTFKAGIAVAFAATLLVLLIACANVANLQLVRASRRSEEIAVRVALGASRTRLVWQLVVESAVLAMLGGAAGMLLGWAGVHTVVARRPGLLSQLAMVQLDRRVLLFGVGVTLLTSVIYGVVPALRATRARLANALRSVSQTGRSRERGRLQSAVVVAEIALTFVLLVGAGLPTSSFLKMLSLDPGFRPDGLLELSTWLPAAKYADSTSRAEYWKQLTDRARGVPGVVDVLPATVGMLQSALGSAGGRMQVDEGPHAALPVDVTFSQRRVSADYFHVMQIRVLDGRVFSPEDERGETDAHIVDLSFAARLWPGESAIGKRYRLYVEGQSLPWSRVVGVVSDVGLIGLQQHVQAMQEYTPARASNVAGITGILVRLRPGANESAALSALKGTFTSVDPEVHAGLALSESAFLSVSLGVPRFVTVLLLVFAAVAILLAAVGLYGVVAHAAAQRTQEIGVRMAMGARSRDIATLILVGGVRLSIVGIAIGLAVALATTRLIAALLFKTSPTDAAVFVIISAALLAVSALASYLPARRAARVDPVIALRAE